MAEKKTKQKPSDKFIWKDGDIIITKKNGKPVKGNK